MKISLVQGMGFADQSHLRSELALHDIDAQIYDIDQPLAPSFKSDMAGISHVIFRSRWSATVEENLFIKTLIKKHQAYFEALDEMVRADKLKVIAVGRGALLWLEWMHFAKRLGSPLAWTSQDLATNSWIETTVQTRQNSTVAMRSLVTGRAFLNRLDAGVIPTTPWVKYGEKTVGWRLGESLYLSLVDTFALSERAQLPDYGYEDLSTISTRSNLVQMLLSGEM